MTNMIILHHTIQMMMQITINFNNFALNKVLAPQQDQINVVIEEVWIKLNNPKKANLNKLTDFKVKEFKAWVQN